MRSAPLMIASCSISRPTLVDSVIVFDRAVLLNVVAGEAAEPDSLAPAGFGDGVCAVLTIERCERFCDIDQTRRGRHGRPLRAVCTIAKQDAQLSALNRRRAAVVPIEAAPGGTTEIT